MLSTGRDRSAIAGCSVSSLKNSSFYKRLKTLMRGVKAAGLEGCIDEI